MRVFKANIFKKTTSIPISCDISGLVVVTTDPTNLEGTNGSATISFSGIQGNSSYSLNSGPAIAAISPITINGLSESTTYTIEVFDDILPGCSKSATFTLGESSFEFDADFFMITYEFLDGRDLDTRTGIALPDVGQSTTANLLGWGVKSVFPAAPSTFITWGGDNTGTGFESVLMDLAKFRELHPSIGEITIDCRAQWYSLVGSLPVNISVKMWKGGTPVKSGYIWTNPTASYENTVPSTGKLITLKSTSNLSSGQRVATFKYNLNTTEGVLNNADTTTPDPL